MANYLNFPFDAELFRQAWGQEPDPVKLALIQSGVLVEDSAIAAQIQNDGNFYTIPFYDVITGTEVNYDGATNITSSETTADSQSGIVYGRAMGLTARNFVAELSGSDPFGNIASNVGRVWNKKYQARVIGILNGVFGITGDADWAIHTKDISSTTGTAAKIKENTLNDVMVETLGDNKSKYRVAIMHSNVAKTLEDLQMFEFWTRTDANGVQRPMNIGTCNGLTVIIDDGVPFAKTGGSGANKDLFKYTTYLLGEGVLRTADGRVDVPAEIVREAMTNGGQDTLVTRIRETIHPNGFSFTVPTTGFTQSPTDAQLFSSANWSRKFNAKAIPMAKLITNG